MQRAYDIIAAYFRCEYPDKEGQLILPRSLPDVGKDLTPVQALKELYIMEWCEFWHQETKDLACKGEIVRAILTAVVYQNTDKGHNAENLLTSLLKERYGMELFNCES